MTAVRLTTDLLCLSVAALGGFLCWSRVNPQATSYHPILWLPVACCIAALASYDMYPGVGMAGVEQIRRMARSISLVYLLLIASMFLMKEWWAQSRGGFLLSWVFSVVLLPLGRWSTVRVCRALPWWGVPSMLIGAGETGRALLRTLCDNPSLGYRPVICLDEDIGKQGSCCGVPILGGLDSAMYYAQEYGIRCVMIGMPELPRTQLLRLLETYSRVFPKILIVPDLFGVASLWTERRDLNGMLALEIQCKLLIRTNQALKRVFDIVLSSLGLLVAAPLTAVASVCIRLSSAGPAIYTQSREGQHGRPVRVYKLRTMYADAEKMLARHLEQDAAARDEWTRYCKLKRDPRVLPVIGPFLRRSSIDELPQLWNVLKGDMSLVGPRPFPSYHVQRFDPAFRRLRAQVRPGLTGLWQVAARSDGDLSKQAELDSYYIRNWSPWLDIYLVICTVRAVLAGRGAY